MKDKKIWVITGISSGIGQALAEELIAQNQFLIGTYRNQKQVDSFNEKYEGKGFAYLLDVTDQNAIISMVEHIKVRFKKIDVLVNNAGVGIAGAVEETSLNEVREVFEANFFGALTLTQEVLPIFRTQQSGTIVQVSSHGGIKAFAGFGIYNASKFALEGFSEALAQEVQSLGIKVMIVEPGPFRTGFAGNRLRLAEKVIHDYSETSGVFREKLQGVHGKQEGDPEKAVKAIINVVESDNPPLRLPLGKVPLTTIQMKLDSVQKDLNDYKEVAESVVFEE